MRATRRILQRSYYLAAMQVLDAAPPMGRAFRACGRRSFLTRCLSGGGSEKDAETPAARDLFCLSGAGKALRRRLAAYHRGRQAALTRTIFRYISGSRSARQRCAYCSFVSQSIERFGEFLPAYLDALLREIAHTGKLLRDSGFHIRTLYIGGGTPTTLSERADGAAAGGHPHELRSFPLSGIHGRGRPP
ncbi:MAG: hypothetical protein ACLU3F_15375 [Blautia wexlerae]